MLYSETGLYVLMEAEDATITATMANGKRKQPPQSQAAKSGRGPK